MSKLRIHTLSVLALAMSCTAWAAGPSFVSVRNCRLATQAKSYNVLLAVGKTAEYQVITEQGQGLDNSYTGANIHIQILANGKAEVEGDGQTFERNLPKFSVPLWDARLDVTCSGKIRVPYVIGTFSHSDKIRPNNPVSGFLCFDSKFPDANNLTVEESDEDQFCYLGDKKAAGINLAKILGGSAKYQGDTIEVSYPSRDCERSQQYGFDGRVCTHYVPAIHTRDLSPCP